MKDLCETCGGGVFPGRQETDCPDLFHGPSQCMWILPEADGEGHQNCQRRVNHRGPHCTNGGYNENNTRWEEPDPHHKGWKCFWEVKTPEKMAEVARFCYENYIDFEVDTSPDWPAGEFPMIGIAEEHSERIRDVLGDTRTQCSRCGSTESNLVVEGEQLLCAESCRGEKHD